MKNKALLALQAKAAWVDANMKLDKLRKEAYINEEWNKLYKASKKIQKICNDVLDRVINEEGDG